MKFQRSIKDENVLTGVYCRFNRPIEAIVEDGKLVGAKPLQQCKKFTTYNDYGDQVDIMNRKRFGLYNEHWVDSFEKWREERDQGNRREERRRA